MGGNRHGELRKMRNLFVSMLIIGLWHGAGWTFIIWGGLHGILLMINHAWRKTGIALPKICNWGMTFLCVMICWVFFRAGSVSEATLVLSNLLDWQTVADASRDEIKHLAGITAGIMVLAVVPNPLVMIKKFTADNKWLLIVCLLFLFSLYNIAVRGTGEFLYFQF